MTRFPFRRSYLPLLVALAGLLAVLHLNQQGKSSRESGAARSVQEERSTPGNSSRRDTAFTRFDSWKRRHDRTDTEILNASLKEGISLASARREAFLELMREEPARALTQATSLREFAALPAKLKPYFEKPISGVGSIDLRWRTNLLNDESLDCKHQHVLYLGKDSFNLIGLKDNRAIPPRRNVPVSGIALGDLAILSPSAVRELAPHELDAAGTLFPIGNPDGLDPVTGQPSTPEHSALLGGRVFQFAEPASIAQVAQSLRQAEESAEENNVFEVAHGFDWLAASGGEGDEGEAPVDATPFQDDTLDVLFIRIDFSDFPGAPVSQLDLETTLTAVRNNVEDYSYNVATIVSTVTPTVYTMPRSGMSYATDPGFSDATPNGNDDIQTDARALAAADYTIANYDVIAVFFPSLNGVSGSFITYGGLGSIGGDRHWINGTNNTNIILHEFGHNYGLYHSNYWDITQTLPGDYDVPSSREYGDIFDRMGSGSAPEGHFNHFHKNRLQWMPDSKVAEPTADGTFRIYRFDHANATANPTLAVKVPMGGDVYYWVGYRQLYPSGTYNLSTGAYIVAEGLSQGAETNLIDATPGSMSPESNDRDDCGLEIGTPFVDSGVTFTAVARGGSAPNEWIDVSISFAGRVGFLATNIDVDETAGTAWLTLQRQFSTAGIASVDFATSNGSATTTSDYYATSGTVNWAAGDSTDKTIAIPINPDALAEGTEAFTVVLSNPTGASLDTLANVATISVLDPGARYFTFSPGFFSNAVYDVELLSNGQSLIGGTISAGSGEFATVHNLARLNPDGSVDPTLATGSGFNDRVRAIKAQPDGKILVGGEFTSYNGTTCNRLIRLNPDGSIDTNISKVDNGIVYSIELESDGKILVGGSFTSFDSTAVNGIVRLTSAGTRDTGNPITPPFFTPWTISIRDIHVQSDGLIMIAGGFHFGGASARSGIARLQSDGARDTAFNPGQGSHVDGNTGLLNSVYSVDQLPDGKYAIGGPFTGFDGNSVTYLARLNNNGSLDGTFSPPALPTTVYSVLAQPSGKILVGLGNSAGGPRLTRLNTSGSTDTTFAIGVGPEGTVYTLAQSEDGSLHVGGNYFFFDGASSRPITRIAGGTAPYDHWALANFTTAELTSGDGDPGADPDADGANNAAERALGTDPNVFTGNNLPQPLAGSALSLHVEGANEFLEATVSKSEHSTGAWFVAQFSSDLITWSPTPALPGTNAVYDIIEDSETTFTIRDKTPLGSDSRFIRIGVRHPE